MRKIYIDNIKWITVVLVVIYHVIYMFNGVTTFGVIGPGIAIIKEKGLLSLLNNARKKNQWGR